MQITIQYGMTTQPKSYVTPPTFGEVIADQNLRAILGYSDNVRPLVYGVEQPLAAIVPDGANVVLETRANAKAMVRQVLRWLLGIVG